MLGLIGSAAALAWYADLTSNERRRADQMAIRLFGVCFQKLTERQRILIKKRLQ